MKQVLILMSLVLNSVASAAVVQVQVGDKNVPITSCDGLVSVSQRESGDYYFNLKQIQRCDVYDIIEAASLRDVLNGTYTKDEAVENYRARALDENTKGKHASVYVPRGLYEKGQWNGIVLLVRSKYSYAKDYIVLTFRDYQAPTTPAPSRQLTSRTFITPVPEGSDTKDYEKALPNCGGFINATVPASGKDIFFNLRMVKKSRCTHFDILGANFEKTSYRARELEDYDSEKNERKAHGRFVVPRSFIVKAPNEYSAMVNTVVAVVRSQDGDVQDFVLLAFAADDERPVAPSAPASPNPTPVRVDTDSGDGSGW